MSLAAPTKVDRQTTTPFLLKLFYRSGTFHRLDEFTTTAPLPPHLQIYTWPTCSLRELTHLLTSALPTLLPSPAIGTRIAFRLLYPDTRSSANQPGRYLARELGSVVVGSDVSNSMQNGSSNGNGTEGGAAAVQTLDGEADKTLQDVRFVIGDYVSCAVIPPLANGAVAAPPTGPGGMGRGGYGGGPPRGGFGGARENGFGGDGGYRGRGGSRGGFSSDLARGGGAVPPGEWRRGERIPEGSGYGGSSAYSRGRGRGGRAW